MTRYPRCVMCGEPFNDFEWERRHWHGPELAECHEDCCPDCEEQT